MEIFYNTVFVCFFYFILGKSFISLKNNFSNTCLVILIGAILLSVFALCFHFIAKLSIFNNSLIFLIILVFYLYKNTLSSIFDKQLFLNLLIISLLSTILIYLADSNRPDAGLYHYPFVKLLNDDKIIFGITNINSRFGTISIIQYLQAITNNYVVDTNGMLLPLSILPMTIYLYFLNEIRLIIKNSYKNKFYLFYIFFCLIFISFKMNRYGEYGNDYIPHFFLFFLVSLFFKFRNKLKFSNIYFFSFFIFLNKIIFLPVLLLPFFNFKIYKKFEKIFTPKNFLISSFILIWILKNVINSGCLFWPIEQTCIKNLSWYNNDKTSVQHVSVLSKVNQAWAKAWPDQKIKKNTMVEYISGYDWVSTWKSKHGKKILNIISIYSIFILLIILVLKYSSKKFPKDKIRQKDKMKIYVFLLFFILCVALWFIKFPVFRFGVSYLLNILIFLCILFSSNIKLNDNNIKIIKYVTIVCLIVFTGKNLIKIKNHQIKYVNYPWPRYYGFNEENKTNTITSVKIENQTSHYKAEGLCMYSKSPCTNENISKHLLMKKKFNYKIYHF